MATVKDPLHSIQARGSIEGCTYSVWRGMNTVRRRARPARRARTTQPPNRSRLGVLARAFTDLTIAQMQAWENWATNHPESNKYGGTFIMSAIQAFVKLGHTGLRLFNAYDDDPPAEEPPATCMTLSAELAIEEGTVTLVWTVEGTGDVGDAVEIQIAGPFMSKGRRSVLERFEYNSQVTGDLLTADVAGLTLDRWYWFRVRYVAATGMVTNWVYDQINVISPV